ncbi:Rib/alpha-like domain-containing protein [Staphylococcus auricularis]|uniref:Rib/alpha-like domain-containing protein n=1 Tax=Staphylococcus auricularis TaxID=29379 RepID=UPI001F32F3D6|nr:Rib/alpha-like domain-containing protein [Staphylococcus auricularis]MCE5039450.1 YPDG domain-containing protein [Staphylococcus auricularis]
MRTDLNGSTFEYTPSSNAAEEHNPGYNPTKTKPGKQVSVDQTGDQNIPQGSKFEIPQTPQGWNANIDQNNGTITVTPPSNTKPGTKQDIPVKVTYPDGTVDNTNAQIEVVSDQAADHNPGYDAATTRPGKQVSVDQSKDPNIPQGSKFEIPQTPQGWNANIDQNNGTITVTPPENTKPGTKQDIPVKVTYPDGTVDNTNAQINVISDQAGDHNPGYNPSTTNPGKPVEVDQTGDNNLPQGTEFEIPEGSTPEGWEATVGEDGKVVVTPSENIKPGTTEDIPVKVKYPDGTTDDAPAKVTVKDTEANQHNPGYNPSTTNPGKPVEVDQTGDNKLPDGTEFEIPEGSTPEGWEATVGEDGKVVVTPSENIKPGTTEDIPVKVKYPDGSTDDAPAKVTVKDTEANQHNPGYKPSTTNPGKPVEVDQTGDNKLPEGTEFEIPEGSTP